MARFDLSITLEYDIITAQDSAELVTRVNERIQSGEGWQPLGGAITHRGILCQVVVREKRPSLEFEIARAAAMAKY